MLDRRRFLELTAGTGVSLAFSPALLRAFQQQSGAFITRAIPSTGERLVATGLSFSNHPGCADQAVLTDVLKAFAEKGGRVYDVQHVNPAAENFHINAANTLGLTNSLFWSTRGSPPNAPPTPGAAFVTGHIDSLLARTHRAKIDLVMLPVAADPSNLAALREEKKAGRVRYIGVQTISVKFQAAQLEAIMRNEPIDFIGVDYDVSNRYVEDAILPLARDRKIAVMAFFPFNNASGLSCTGGTSLFTRVANTPLPAWAAEFDATTWSQFFLKYVLSHPAITVARTGTTKVAHLIDNLGGGVGRLPNEATRKRMAELIDALPPAPPPVPPAVAAARAPGIAVPAAVLDRYVGEYAAPSGFTAIFRREGTTLFVKPGTNPETALNARSETRFQDPRGPVFEFQLDAQGKVTGAVLEQGAQKLPLARK